MTDADQFIGPEILGETVECPMCGRVSRTGTPVCAHCGALFEAGLDTLAFDSAQDFAKSKFWPKGQALVCGQQTVFFEINGTQLPLPLAGMLSVGRAMNNSDFQPTVDLSPFNAQEKGVSRHHATITQKGLLLYVSDADSTNGTWLNGHRLAPRADWVLRNGDELQLGKLRIKVVFAL